MTGAVWRLAAALLWLSAAKAGAGTIGVVHYDARVTVDIAAGAIGSVEQEAGLFTLLSASYGRTLLNDPSDVWLEAHEFAHQWCTC